MHAYDIMQDISSRDNFFSNPKIIPRVINYRKFPGTKILTALKTKPVTPQTIHVLAFDGFQFP